MTLFPEYCFLFPADSKAYIKHNRQTDKNNQCQKREESSNLKRISGEENCIEQTSKGCVRCSDGYYKENNACIKCNKPCKQCSNATYCTQCDEYSNLVNGTCISMNTLIRKCKTRNMWPNNKGCASCIDGYHKADDGRDCELCPSTCKTCLDKNSCLTCKDNYYLNSKNTQTIV